MVDTGIRIKIFEINYRLLKPILPVIRKAYVYHGSAVTKTFFFHAWEPYVLEITLSTNLLDTSQMENF